MKAMEEAREYYMLPADATFRDVITHVRADEACHRDLNHHFADIPSYEDVDAHKVTIVKEDFDQDGSADSSKLEFTKEQP